MNCLFCKIINKEIPAEIISENDNYIAFLDVSPRAKGHALVVPKLHVGNILELDKDEVGPLFHGLKQTTKLIKDSLRPDGFTIGINHGIIAGQAVEHLHLHIIPRFEGDGGSSIHEVVNNPPNEDLAEVAEKIRKTVS